MSSTPLKVLYSPVPCLSVGNWGGIMLHLRGNVEGYLGAGTSQKWLRFITGRHDIPFYLPEYVALQRSFRESELLSLPPKASTHCKPSSRCLFA
jgi:hypothetical protein